MTNNQEFKNFTQYQKNLFYIFKALSVFCIVMLHSHYKSIEYSLMPLLIERFARAGVFIFILLAGYFYHPKNFVSFWKKKVNSFFVPWMIAGLLTYGIYHFRSGVYFKPMEIVNWILGNGSWLYFMTVVSCCYLICFKFYNSSKIIFITILLTLISVLLTAFGYFKDINPYLNIFNWIGIFSLGIYLQKFNLDKIIAFLKKYFLIVIPICITIFILTTIFDKDCSYWSYYSLISELSISIILFYIALVILNIRYLNVYLVSLGKKTLYVYLYHVIFVNHILVSNSLDKSLVVVLIRPICVVVLLDIIHICLNNVLKAKINKIYNILLGIR